MMKISAIGIALSKSTFHVYGVDGHGNESVRRCFSRAKLHRFMANLEPCRIGMEACPGAHYWARHLREYGHEVRLISPQFVKPYVKSNKNDYLDAEAICEALTRPNMRFVPVKNVEQQGVQMLHRARSRAVAQRTAQANQIRGFLLEMGIVVARGIGHLRRRLPEVLEDAENELTVDIRALLAELRDELVRLDERVVAFDQRIEALAREHEACRRLQTIPGVGPVIATALTAAVGDASAFRSAREMAAWLGLVPRQHSTGGKPRLLGISKRGDAYLRTLLIHGARAALRSSAARTDRRSRWATALAKRRGSNVAAVGLANKIARTAWALLRRQTCYELAVS